MRLTVYIFTSELERESIDRLEWKSEKEKGSIHRSFKFEIITSILSSVELVKRFRDSYPVLICTVGSYDFSFLSLPQVLEERRINFSKVSDLTSERLIDKYMNIEPDRIGRRNGEPLLSVFTPTFKSGERIMRPYNSLLNQTYKNWEWIIVDDSCEKDKDEETWKRLRELEDSDFRIRIYRASRNSGFIGNVKQTACGLSRGDWLLEVDHDDELVPDLFSWIVDCSKKNPDVGFIYTDCIECDENTKKPHSYNLEAGHGYCAYVKKWIPDDLSLLKHGDVSLSTDAERREKYLTGKYQNVYQAHRNTPHTLRHIVGVPNHIRCWRSDVYFSLRGHREDFPVADDYELILRTFLVTKFCRIAELGYIQYRNEGGSNFTFLRNELIQDITWMTSNSFDIAITDRIKELGGNPEHKWDMIRDYHKTKFDYPRLESIYRPKQYLLSVILPTFANPDLERLTKSILSSNFTNFELYIIGDNCPLLNREMEKEIYKTDSRVKWWNLDKCKSDKREKKKDDDMTDCINYAIKMLVTTTLICVVDEDKESQIEKGRLGRLIISYDERKGYGMNGEVYSMDLVERKGMKELGESMREYIERLTQQ